MQGNITPKLANLNGKKLKKNKINNLNFSWAKNAAEWREAAEFFARVISENTAYVSHGEIQTGLSPDGVSWVPDLGDQFLRELGEFDQSRGVLIVKDEAGHLVAAANITWDKTFATIQDMAVDPVMRSSGIGATMMEQIEDAANARDMKWLFLESGKNNQNAHRFFERHGLVEISHVFAKRLDKLEK